jgi:4-amino-4-deoxy-L-arabinose transferase-like glycosyltransferase
MVKKTLPIIFILLLAFIYRAYDLTSVPPGLTHDEANHGWDSMNVLDGVLLFYFPLNYGSEPLYNYVVAGSMALIGENLLALRLVNVMFGLLTIAAAYLWTCWAFNRYTALVTAALIAISFWPVASSRQALRAGMLPFLVISAAIFFWLIFRPGRRNESSGLPTPNLKIGWAVFGFALSVTATLHTYLAARVLWLLYPIFLVYLAFSHRASFQRIWKPVLAGLILAGLLVIPMFAYVEAHPEAETRLQMLEGPLQSLLSGDLSPVFTNAWEAFLAFVWPGFGDHFLAYNIPGRPVLEAVTAFFFLAGLVACLWRIREPAYAFALIWFGVGIVPSLVTGPEANTTRNLAALAPTYILAATGFVTLATFITRRWGSPARIASASILALWLFFIGLTTIVDYFIRWAQSPDVRAAYQHTLVEALDYLDGQSSDKTTVISTIYPGPAHDPSIARVLLAGKPFELRWIDARRAIIYPGGQATQLILPSSTPLHPAFTGLVRPVETVEMRSDDLDPAFTSYDLLDPAWDLPDTSPNFGDALDLIGSRWLNDSARPGELAELMTIWRVTDPAKVGPVVPPAFETDMVLFTHVIDDSGDIIAQQDSLEAPSWDWQAGDIFIQVHPVTIPEGVPPGNYETTVGAYDRSSGERIPLLNPAGEIVDNRAFVVPLKVDER